MLRTLCTRTKKWVYPTVGVALVIQRHPTYTAVHTPACGVTREEAQPGRGAFHSFATARSFADAIAASSPYLSSGHVSVWNASAETIGDCGHHILGQGAPCQQ